MVNFSYLDDINDGNGDVYIHWDVQILLLVKAEGCNFLVVVFLDDNEMQWGKEGENITFIKSSLQLPSSDSSRQLEVWSHLCSIWMHWPSLQVNLPEGQVVSFTCLILQRNLYLSPPPSFPPPPPLPSHLLLLLPLTLTCPARGTCHPSRQRSQHCAPLDRQCAANKSSSNKSYRIIFFLSSPSKYKILCNHMGDTPLSAYCP